MSASVSKFTMPNAGGAFAHGPGIGGLRSSLSNAGSRTHGEGGREHDVPARAMAAASAASSELAAAGRLGEEDVEPDGGRPTAADDVEDLAWSSRGHGQGKCRASSKDLVDADDDDGGGGGVRPAEVELAVQGLELGHAEIARGGPPRGQHDHQAQEATREEVPRGRAEESHRGQLARGRRPPKEARILEAARGPRYSGHMRFATLLRVVIFLAVSGGPATRRR